MDKKNFREARQYAITLKRAFEGIAREKAALQKSNTSPDLAFHAISLYSENIARLSRWFLDHGYTRIDDPQDGSFSFEDTQVNPSDHTSEHKKEELRQKYLRIKMDDDSVWEVAYEPLIRLAVARGIEDDAFSHMNPDEQAEHLRWCLEDVKEPSQVHDDLLDLTWAEVLSVGAKMVQPPTPPPYEQWWKETHSFGSLEAVYRDIEPETKG